MQHLSEEQLVAFHYRDLDSTVDASQHLATCEGCSAQYNAIRGVLAIVSEAPIPERGENYGAEVWTRLRWKLGRRASRRWQSLAAMAAMLAVAFLAGLLWNNRKTASPELVTATEGKPAAVTASADKDTERLLVVVVNDHLDSSGRFLQEVANAGADDALSMQPQRVEDLVTANRIYRQTAQQKGDERIAELLSDLEPILLELANAGSSLEGKKLADLQRRIDSKGLLFKVRVMSAPDSEAPPRIDNHTDSL
jgi:anti-sigma-K factor RskA